MIGPSGFMQAPKPAMPNVRTLMSVLPREFMGPEYADIPARKYAHLEIVWEKNIESSGCYWPGHHKNVYYWVELSNGMLVGWNENPGRGWSFPMIKAKKSYVSH